MTRTRITAWLTARLVTQSYVYLTCLFAWFALHVFWGDRWWWLFLINSFGIYLFLPLPLLLAIALITRRRDVWIGLSVSLTLWAYLFGSLFLPRFPQARASNLTLNVMTYNMLGFNAHPESVVAAIHASNADVVAVQELNPPAADAIRRDLMREYPYQVLDPQPGVTGLGVLSRYPLVSNGESLSGNTWVGTPQVLRLDWNGTAIIVLHFHPVPTNLGPRADMEWSVRERERQAHVIADFVTAHPNPLIAPVDFNANDSGVPAHGERRDADRHR